MMANPESSNTKSSEPSAFLNAVFWFSKSVKRGISPRKNTCSESLTASRLVCRSNLLSISSCVHLIPRLVLFDLRYLFRKESGWQINFCPLKICNPPEWSSWPWLNTIVSIFWRSIFRIWALYSIRSDELVSKRIVRSASIRKDKPCSARHHRPAVLSFKTLIFRLPLGFTILALVWQVQRWWNLLLQYSVSAEQPLHFQQIVQHCGHQPRQL